MVSFNRPEEPSSHIDAPDTDAFRGVSRSPGFFAPEAPSPYNRAALPHAAEPHSIRMIPEQANSIAVVVEDSDAFHEMKRGLLPGFRAKLAGNEHAIKDAVEDPTLQAMLFDLDCVGEGAPDGIEVIQEIRSLRDDIVLVAMTRSREHSIPLRASQAGADEFVVAPVN